MLLVLVRVMASKAIHVKPRPRLESLRRIPDLDLDLVISSTPDTEFITVAISRMDSGYRSLFWNADSDRILEDPY